MITIENLIDNFHEDLNGQITKLSSRNGDLSVCFECDSWIDTESRMSFNILCHDFLEKDLQIGFADIIDFTDNHQVLWPYHCEHAHLYFSSPPKNSYEIVGRLFETHERLMQGWKPFKAYINYSYNSDLPGLLEGGYGLLANGPKILLKEYAKAIGNKMKLNIITSFNRLYDSSKPFKALIFDDGFIVCKGITVIENS